MYKDNTEVKGALFNGTVLDRILLNGVEVYKRILDVFKNGVLHESCSFKEYYNESTIEDGTIYNSVSQSTVGTPEHSYCYINMDLTDYKLLKIKGQYWYGGHCSISYGIDSVMGNYLTLSENGTEYTIEIDVTEYTGLHYLGMDFIANGMTSASDWVFLQNYISEITLE